MEEQQNPHRGKMDCENVRIRKNGKTELKEKKKTFSETLENFIWTFFWKKKNDVLWI